MGRVEFGLQEDAAVGDGLQRGRALVGEPKPNEELSEEETRTGVRVISAKNCIVKQVLGDFFAEYKFLCQHFS